MKKINDLAEITTVLNKYPEEVTKEIKEAITDSAEELAKTVKNVAPVRKTGTSRDKNGNSLPAGTYAKAWKKKLDEETDTMIRYRVLNSGKQKSLAHLLEFGHQLPEGGTVPAIKHILKNRDKIESALSKKVEEILKNANIE